MRQFLLDTGIAGMFINRRSGVHERAVAETARGNRVGICHPVLAELVYGVEYSTSRDRNMQRLQLAWRPGRFSRPRRRPPSSTAGLPPCSAGPDGTSSRTTS